MVLCIIVIAGQNYAAFMGDQIDWQGILVSYIGLPLFLALYIGYKLIKKTKSIKAEEADISGFNESKQ